MTTTTIDGIPNNPVSGPVAPFNSAGADIVNLLLGIAITSNGDGIDLGNKGAWTANIDGSINAIFYGMLLMPGNVAASIVNLSETSSIDATIGLVVGSDGDGAAAAGGAVTINNAGNIHDADQAIWLNSTGAHIINNTGMLIGAGAGIVAFNASNETVTNSGTITRLFLANGTNILNNTGFVQGSYTGGTGNDTVTNAANSTINGPINLGDGTNSVTNAGTIGTSGDLVDIQGSVGADTVTNSGTIEGAVFLGTFVATETGTNIFNNSGSVGVDGAVTLVSYKGGRGIDTITNSGTLEGGIVAGGATDLATGNNTLTNTATGSIGGAGNGHAYLGGSAGDKITNAGTMTGAQTIDLGDGTNSVSNSGTITATAGFAIVGGSGNDTITNTGSMGGVSLGSGTNMLTNSGSVGAGPSNRSYAGTAGADTVINTASGTMANDIDLGGGANKLDNKGTMQWFYGGSDADIVANSGSMGGIRLSGGTNSASNTGSVGGYILAGSSNDTVSNTSTALTTATISSDVNLGDGKNSFTNTGGSVGISGFRTSYQGGTGNDTVNNLNIATARAVLHGGVLLGDGDNILINSGDIASDASMLAIEPPADPTGFAVQGGSGKDSVTNSALGIIAHGGLDLGNGVNSLTNAGEITGVDLSGRSYLGGTGSDTTNNTGTMAGGVTAANGTELAGSINKLTNSGSIGADTNGYSYVGGQLADTITNTGTLSGGVDAGAAGSVVAQANVFVNSGTVGGGGTFHDSYESAGGINTVTNTGTMLGALVFSGAGTTTLTNQGQIGKDSGGESVVAHSATGIDTVTNGGAADAVAVIDGGVYLGDGANKLTNAGVIGYQTATGDSYRGASGVDTIINSGVMSGGIDAGYGSSVLVANSLNNSGQVGTDVAGLSYRGDIGADTITNTGQLLGSVDMRDSGATAALSNVLNNTGALAEIGKSAPTGSTVVLGGDHMDSVTNSGTIWGAIDLNDGVNTLVNGVVKPKVVTGVIHADADGGSYYGGADADNVTNTAGSTIEGSLLLGSGANVVTNSGAIGAGDDNYGIVMGINNDSVTNTATGTILGAVTLGDGANTLTNSGVMGGGSAFNEIIGGTGVDKITNTGLIKGGVTLGDGGDLLNDFSGKVHGTIIGIIDMGDGNDTMNGGNNAETVRDGNGADKIMLSGGNDTYIATGATNTHDGVDTINGGDGIDTYDASGLARAVVNLDTVAHTETGLNFWGASATAGNAHEVDAADPNATAAGTQNDIISLFENATGGNGHDILFGSTGNNVLNGGGGDDDLWGYGGNDTINGGNGGDFIVGGAGKDVLTGGNDSDVFWYFSTTDSGVGAANRDVITDFSTEDHIALSQIDANTTNGTNQPTDDFHLLAGINTPFGLDDPGALHLLQTANGWIIEGNVNNDTVADFSIEVLDPMHNLTYSDFSTGITL